MMEEEQEEVLDTYCILFFVSLSVWLIYHLPRSMTLLEQTLA